MMTSTVLRICISWQLLKSLQSKHKALYFTVTSNSVHNTRSITNNRESTLILVSMETLTLTKQRKTSYHFLLAIHHVSPKFSGKFRLCWMYHREEHRLRQSLWCSERWRQLRRAPFIQDTDFRPPRRWHCHAWLNSMHSGGLYHFIFW